jgi:hypothetical protein
MLRQPVVPENLNAAIEDVAVRRLCWILMRLCRDLCAVVI